jgi:hypothetical protein
MLAEKSTAGETRQRNLNHHAEGLTTKNDYPEIEKKSY